MNDRTPQAEAVAALLSQLTSEEQSQVLGCLYLGMFPDVDSRARALALVLGQLSADQQHKAVAALQQFMEGQGSKVIEITEGRRGQLSKGGR